MPSRAPVQLPRWVDQLLAVAGVDWEPSTRQPPARGVVLATVVALAGSLVADALLVAGGTHLFPATRGFSHFRPGDYGALTSVGVVTACAAWPVATRVASAPRRLFFRLAVAVSLVLLLPDAWILLRGEPARAVGVLVAMHLAVAVVTYQALVVVAPAGRRRRGPGSARPSRQNPAHSVRTGAAPIWPGSPSTGTDTPTTRAPSSPETGAAPVPLDESVRRAVTAFPAGDGERTGPRRPRSAVEASVVPLRPKAAPPAAGSRGAVEGGALEGGGGPAANVVLPPASLAEPRSAIRLLPSSSGEGSGPPGGATTPGAHRDDGLDPPGPADDAPTGADGDHPLGRHVRRGEDAGAPGSDTERAQSARRPARRGRHAARS